MAELSNNTLLLLVVVLVVIVAFVMYNKKEHNSSECPRGVCMPGKYYPCVISPAYSDQAFYVGTNYTGKESEIECTQQNLKTFSFGG